MKCLQTIVPPGQNLVFFTQRSLWSLFALEKTFVGVTELPNMQFRRVKEGTSALLVQSGLSEKVVDTSNGTSLLLAKKKKTGQTGRQKVTV